MLTNKIAALCLTFPGFLAVFHVLLGLTRGPLPAHLLDKLLK